jgi:hypothetical protein
MLRGILLADPAILAGRSKTAGNVLSIWRHIG